MPAGELAVRGITPSLLVCGMVIPIPNPVTMHLPWVETARDADMAFVYVIVSKMAKASMVVPEVSPHLMEQKPFSLLTQV